MKRRRLAQAALPNDVEWKAQAKLILSPSCKEAYMSSEESAPEEDQEAGGKRVRRLRRLQHESVRLTTIKRRLDRFYLADVAGRESLSQLGTCLRDNPVESRRSIPKRLKWAYRV